MSKSQKQSDWWSYIYTKDDLTFILQSFKNESKVTNLFRIALMLANLNNILLIVYLYNFHRLLKFFTNWTIIVTVIYFGFAITAS